MQNKPNYQAVILLTDGFDESWLANCLIGLRTSNKHTAVVGLRPGPVTGQHGLVIHTDNYMTAIRGATPKLLAIADGRLCIKRLMNEPRVYQMIEQTLASNGRVGASLHTETILKKYRLIDPETLPQYIWQRHKSHQEYVQLLVESFN